MITTREAIIHETRNWIGTRFHHQGRKKHSGCDCIGLVMGVAKACELISPLTPDGKKHYLYEYDEQNYSKIPDGKQLYEKLSYYLPTVAIDRIQPGDLGLFRFDNNPQHVGIFGNYAHGGLSLIHCYMQARKVVEHRFDERWQERLVAAFSLI